MFSRFRDSLVYPRRIIDYRKDKLIRVLGYMFLFAILMLSSTVVLLLRFDRMPQNVRDLYQENLKDTEINCVLDEGNMTCDEDTNESFYVETFGLVQVLMGVNNLKPDFSDASPLQMQIIFSDEKLYVYYSTYELEFTYDELPEEFSNVDFALVQSDPEAFTDIMMDGTGEYLKSIGGTVASILLISGFIGNIFMVLFIVFMNSIILKMRFRVIPYGETFKMGAYLGTSLYILMILNGFFGMGILMIIIFLILTFRQTNAISYEIMRRMKK